jgi:hypothetical protein
VRLCRCGIWLSDVKGAPAARLLAAGDIPPAALLACATRPRAGTARASAIRCTSLRLSGEHPVATPHTP